MEQRMNYYERLFEWDYNGEVSPLLVKDFEWIDELHLKITLYDNITTHSGKKLTTEDVKFSLEYAKDSAEFARHTTNIDYDNIEITDDYTMVIPNCSRMYCSGTILRELTLYQKPILRRVKTR